MARWRILHDIHKANNVKVDLVANANIVIDNNILDYMITNLTKIRIDNKRPTRKNTSDTEKRPCPPSIAKV